MKRVMWLTGFVLVFAAGVVAGAQGLIVGEQGIVVTPGGAPAGERILSGADIGFQVEGEGRDGALKGRFLVKEDGKWKEIELTPRIRIVR